MKKSIKNLSNNMKMKGALTLSGLAIFLANTSTCMSPNVSFYEPKIPECLKK